MASYCPTDFLDIVNLLMADLATAEKNPIEKEIDRLNAREVTTPEEAIEVLTELNKIGGKLIKDGVLEKSIESNFLGKLDVYSIPTVISALEKFEASVNTDFDNSVVPVAKINELVDDYEEYLKKGLNDKEAADKVYKDNKGKISRQNIEQFIKRQQELYQENLKKINQIENQKTAGKVVDLNKYKEEKKAVEKKAEIISKQQFKLENKIEEVLTENLTNNEVKKDVEKVAQEVSEQVFEKVILGQEVSSEKQIDQVIKQISEELPYSIIKTEDKEVFKTDLKEEIAAVQADIQIEEKTWETTEKIISELKKDERVEELIKRNSGTVEKKVETAVKNVILGEEILTESEQVNDLSSEVIKIIKEEEDHNNFRQEPPINRTAIKAVDLELNNWIKTNETTVQEFRGNTVAESIGLQIYQENPNLTKEERIQVDNYQKLIKKVYYSDDQLDKYKNEIIGQNNEISPGQRDNAWTDLKAITNLLRRKPEEVKEILNNYNAIKNGLKDVNLPFGIKECRSFDKIANLLSNPETQNLFFRAQKYIQAFDKFRNIPNAFLERIGLRVANTVVEKIGNQAVKAFAENSLKIIAEKGLQTGLQTILKGILSGGVRAAASAGASAAAAGGAAAGGAAAASAAVPVVGWIVAAAILAYNFILKPILNKLKGALEKMGLSLGIGKFLKETFGNFFGGILEKGVAIGGFLVGLPTIISSAASATMLGPILIGVVVGLFILQLFQGSLISSLVPPTERQDTTDTVIGGQRFDPGSVQTLNFNFNVPVIGATFTRADLVNVAQSILGLGYFWGGKWNNKGVNPRWGELTTVTAGGNWSTGMQIPLGLDCSGYVNWVYNQLTGRSIGGGSGDICAKASPVSRSDLKPGDVGCMDGHVGLFIGYDTDSEPLFIQAVGQRYRDNSKGLVAGQILILKEGKAYNGYTGPRFTSYGRPAVSFQDN